MSSRMVMTASTAALGIFGSGWLLLPEMMYKYWAIVPDPDRYMGRRYGAFMLGLAVISWLAAQCSDPQSWADSTKRAGGPS